MWEYEEMSKCGATACAILLWESVKLTAIRGH